MSALSALSALQRSGKIQQTKNTTWMEIAPLLKRTSSMMEREKADKDKKSLAYDYPVVTKVGCAATRFLTPSPQ